MYMCIYYVCKQEEEEEEDPEDADPVEPAAGGSAGGAPAAAASGCAGNPSEPEPARGVDFLTPECGESTDEFRSHRRQHYSHEWKADASVAAAVSSLETNTNTNLNAGRGKGSPGRRRLAAFHPHDRGVAFGELEPTSPPPPSVGFAARRRDRASC